jgi:catechol 2,3-dioxygenase-like lactoylglutathione lyase family enzyme
MNIGWCDVCITVKSAAVSREFYELLGFRRVEGDDDKGWAVITNDDLRLGLFESRYMDGRPFTLNSRGGDVFAIAEELQSNGVEFPTGPKRAANGGCSATIHDPDGHLIFFDTASGETKKE